MPYTDQQNHTLDVSDEQIVKITTSLIDIRSKNPSLFLAFVHELAQLIACNALQNEVAIEDQICYLTSITMGYESLAQELLRKYQLIKFLHSASTDGHISNTELIRLGQFIRQHQDQTIEEFCNELMLAGFPEKSVDSLMSLVPGYFFVKDALPLLFIDIYFPSLPNRQTKVIIPRIEQLRLFPVGIIDDVSTELNAVRSTSLSEHYTYPVIKPKPRRSIQFDDATGIELKIFKQHNTSPDNRLTPPPLPLPKNRDKQSPTAKKAFTPSVSKAFIQLIFFKHIASDPRVTQSDSRKIWSDAQTAIEKICTMISGFAEPQIKTTYEDEEGFKIAKFIRNSTRFWHGINVARQRRQIEQRPNGNSRNNQSHPLPDSNTLRHSDYLEIPDKESDTTVDSNKTKILNRSG